MAPKDKRRIDLDADTPELGQTQVAAKRGGMRRFFGRAARIPLIAFPTREIMDSGRLIAHLAGNLRRRGEASDRIHYNDDRKIDMPATAFTNGLTEQQLEALLRRRQHDLARAAWLCFGVGCALFIGLAWELLITPTGMGGVVEAIYFFPFGSVFFIIAFRNALQNYQLRQRRLATAWEYVMTPDSFWPC